MDSFDHGGVMGLIADECPQCRRVTRCVVTENGGFFGGLVLGIPFILPYSSPRCVCSECGYEFPRRSSASSQTIPPEQAAHLDIDTLLGLTNPELKRTRTLLELNADPRLQGAFVLLEQLPPGSLRVRLQNALSRWPDLGEAGRGEFLAGVEACARAVGFTRTMAERYTTGAVGCLVGVSGAVGVWVWAGLAYKDLGLWGWILVAAAGLVVGGLPCGLIWYIRDRRWVREVLLPEAERSGVSPGWVLAVLEGAAGSRSPGDELTSIRHLGTAIRREWAATSGTPGDEVIGFEPLVEVIACPECGAKSPRPSEGEPVTLHCPSCRHSWSRSAGPGQP